MRNRFAWILFILSLAFASLACSSLLGGGDENEAPTAAAAPSEAVAVPTQESQTQTDSGDSEVAQLNADTLWDQSDLTSFRAEYVMTFDGFSGENSIQGTMNMLIEQTSDPAAQHVLIDFQDVDFGLEGVNHLEMYVVDDITYTNFGIGEGWMAIPGGSMDQMSEALAFPQDMLDLPPTARRSLLPETVNGVSAWHYVLDENDITAQEMQYDSLKADVWVAVDGGFLVKMDATVSGVYSGANAEEQILDKGTIQMVFNMREVNQPFTIELPPEASDAEVLSFDGLSFGSDWTREDIPLPEDAAIDFSSDTLVSFSTSLSLEDATQQIIEDLQANGWAMVGAPIEAQGNYTATFAKESEKLLMTIVANPGTQGSSVVITLEQ